MIHLLAMGSNYTGESYALPDCELDCANVVKAFGPYCATATLRIGKQATRAGVRSAVAKFIKELEPTDMGILYWSGHGTTDRVGGKRVEAIVCDGAELIYDFEMRADLNKRAAGSMLVAAADSCYSGGLPRELKRKAKKLALEHCVRHTAKLPAKTPAKPNAIYTACGQEVSYSTGKGGAFTLAFLKAFSERKDKTTLPALYQRIRKLLPSREWPQTPTFTCDKSLEGRTLKSFVTT